MSKKGRVLIVEENNTVPFDVRVWSEATTLRDAGWQVTVVCPAGGSIEADASCVTGTPQTIDGITVYRFPLTYAEHGLLDYVHEYLWAFVSVARLSWRVWQHGPFAVIHFCNPPDIFFPIALFYRLLGRGIVFDQHDLVPELVAVRYPGARGKLLYCVARVMEYLTYRVASVVVSTNHSYRRIAIERGHVSEDRAIVVRNGPKIDTFVPVQPVPALKRGFPYLACYVGKMGTEDGLLELVSSIRHIVHALGRNDILFALIGDGPVRGEALANAKAFGLEKIVESTGWISDDLLLRRYMCTADVLLSPEPPNPLNLHSTFVKIGEYMAMGKPIVAFDLHETRYTADEAAAYVEPGNIEAFGEAIVSLVDDPERARHMGEIGRQRILDGLGWEHQQQNLLQAYALALGQNRELRDRWPAGLEPGES